MPQPLGPITTVVLPFSIASEISSRTTLLPNRLVRFFRTISRAELLGVRTQPYVDAATALGASSHRVLWRHALPNALGPAIVATTLGVGNAILLESGLSFLGLGIQPPQPSWGNMIAGGRDLIVAAPWVAIAPGLALVATVLACTLLGDSLRDRLAGETGTTLRDRA